MRAPSSNSNRSRVVAERGAKGALGRGARHIDRGIEGVAAATDAETPVAAARELDQDLADRDHAGSFAGSLLGHARLSGSGFGSSMDRGPGLGNSLLKSGRPAYGPP